MRRPNQLALEHNRGGTYDRSKDAADCCPPIVCAKLVEPAPVCRGCVDGNADMPFGAPKPQLGPLAE